MRGCGPGAVHDAADAGSPGRAWVGFWMGARGVEPTADRNFFWLPDSILPRTTVRGYRACPSASASLPGPRVLEVPRAAGVASATAGSRDFRLCRFNQIPGLKFRLAGPQHFKLRGSPPNSQMSMLKIDCARSKAIASAALRNRSFTHILPEMGLSALLAWVPRCVLPRFATHTWFWRLARSKNSASEPAQVLV